MIKHAFVLLALLFVLSVTASAQTTEKKIYSEPMWYASIAASSLDIVSSALVIDGIKIKEGNPLLVDKNGKVHWPRAIAFTVGVHTAEYFTHKRSRKWGIVVMVVNVVVRGGIGGARNMYLYYKHVY